MRAMGNATNVTIAIVGDFDRRKHSHWATEAAFFTPAHGWRSASSRIGWGRVELAATDQRRFSRTSTACGERRGARLRASTECSAPSDGPASRARPISEPAPAFNTRSSNSRETRWESATANTAEEDSVTKNVVITPVECPLPGRASGAPRLGGTDVAVPAPGTSFERICGAGDRREEYFCNFETNADSSHAGGPLGFASLALGPRGEMRALELPSHPFFVATLFQPQLSSSFASRIRWSKAFLRACAKA